MKVALVHDYIKEYGGAERVLEALHEIFPDAPIYTTVYLPKFLGPHRERFENLDIRTSFLQYFPFRSKLISPFRILSPLAFKSFDFKDYDVVIVSATGAYFPNSIHCHPQNDNDSGQARMTGEDVILGTNEVRTPESDNYTLDAKRYPLQICYCHTPPRYLYGFATARNWKENIILRILGETANYFLRKTDYKASKNVDYYIANSEEVASRIKKFYGREAKVIYPPVEVKSSKYYVESIKYKEKKEIHNTKYVIHDTDYYLAGGRLARAKGMDIIIQAFSQLDKPLKIFGKGFAGYEDQLKVKSEKLKVKNVEFLGEVRDEEKMELMRNAKAFVFASFDEDFGIAPVEAMSVGTPVIAYKSGGVQETVIDPSTDSTSSLQAGSGSPTGLFYEPNDSAHLIEAVQEFEKMKIDPKDCIKQAQKFSKDKFKKSITEFIKKAAI